MRHLKKGRKFGRSNSHRKAMLNNLAISILKFGKIQTTSAKAKDVRKIVEKLISIGKNNTIHNKRRVFKVLKNRTLVKNLFDIISIKYINKSGGYTRILKNGFRKGDCAPISVIELVNMQ